MYLRKIHAMTKINIHTVSFSAVKSCKQVRHLPAQFANKRSGSLSYVRGILYHAIQDLSVDVLRLGA